MIAEAACLLSFALSALLLPFLEPWLTARGLVRPNFRNRMIPTAMGLAWVLVGSLACAAACLVEKRLLWATFSLALLGYGGLGFLDDRWGSRAYGGLKGHLRALLRDRLLTTGLIKAAGGALFGLGLAALIDPRSPFVWLNAFLVALSSNAVNLLDVRPGRAAKGSLLYAAALAAAGGGEALAALAIPFASLFAYLPRDLRCRAMMGDTGAGSLGAACGLAAAWFLAPAPKYACLGLLLALHALTEAVSLTRLITKSRFLSFLDRLGVREER